MKAPEQEPRVGELDALLPCPFCGDPMRNRHDVIGHVDQGSCVIGAYAWGGTFLAAWNRRAALRSGEPVGDAGLIEHMVNRFLRWKLPENFNPDGGISFQKTTNEGTDYAFKHEPVGTNLFDYVQATAMVHHMVESLPIAALSRPAVEPVAVKALDWSDHSDGVIEARTPIGVYTVRGRHLKINGYFTETFANVAEAKAAAQADYETRIRSALTAPPVQQAERCPMRQAERPHAPGRPAIIPGPSDAPVFCVLPEGHEGPHFSNLGGPLREPLEECRPASAPAEQADLVEALRFYANRQNYRDGILLEHIPDSVAADEGERARAALQKQER